MPWTRGFELNDKGVWITYATFGFCEGVYEYGSVYKLCMSITGCLWELRRVYMNMELFTPRTIVTTSALNTDQ